MRVYHQMFDFVGTPGLSLSSPQRVYARWLAALRSGDPERVLQLYADDAVLWGAWTDAPKFGRELIRGDYEKLLRLPGVEIAPRDAKFRTLGKDLVIATGSYELRLGSGARRFLQARFTIIFRQDGSSGSWEIFEHLCSLPGASPDQLRLLRS